eukprot:5497487-Prymnesium_polylepis.1
MTIHVMGGDILSGVGRGAPPARARARVRASTCGFQTCETTYKPGGGGMAWVERESSPPAPRSGRTAVLRSKAGTWTQWRTLVVVAAVNQIPTRD